MRAMVITQYGPPDGLRVEQRPIPDAEPGHVVVRVRAIGLNHAELYMRRGEWGDVPRITGIECAGEVAEDGDGRLERGTRVVAIVGGMGRTLDGCYAEYVKVPATNVVPIVTSLPWERLAAIPEVYATAWMCLHRQLRIARGETLLVRGGTSAVGQAAIDVAHELGLTVFATTRSPARLPLIASLGAEPLLESAELSVEFARRSANGVDAVLDLVGTRTLVDSLACAKLGSGRVCFAGFLGGFEPIAQFNPLIHLPSGVALSFFASAFELGQPVAPLSQIPFQQIVDRVATGAYRTKPPRVFAFDQIPDAHRLMESNGAAGKVVALVGA